MLVQFGLGSMERQERAEFMARLLTTDGVSLFDPKWKGEMAEHMMRALDRPTANEVKERVRRYLLSPVDESSKGPKKLDFSWLLSAIDRGLT